MTINDAITQAYNSNDANKLKEIILTNFELFEHFSAEQTYIRNLFSNALKDSNFEIAKALINGLETDYISWILIREFSGKSIMILPDTYYKVKFLLENGADPNAEDTIHYNQSILHYATSILYYSNKNDLTDEMIEQIDKIIELLLDYGADPNQQDGAFLNSTPWYKYLFSKNVKIIKKFLEKGADYDLIINNYSNCNDEDKCKIPIYNMSILYKDMIESKNRAINSVKQLTVDKLYMRVGGINIKEY
jgi:hypothetical protein